MGNKKALIVATTPYMIKQFLLNDIKILQDLGYMVEVATNFKSFDVISEPELNKLNCYFSKEDIKEHNIGFSRNMSDFKSHIISYRECKELLKKNEYSLIHTHTPISSFIIRVAYKKSDIFDSCRMIYTAHGFHFFKGNNPIKNFVFKNIERYAAKYTDMLITINKEDYEAAKGFKLKSNGKVEYVPGVGIDIEKINSIEGNKEELCKELNIPKDSILLLSVGELNENKNHKVVIECLPDLPKYYHYIICGQGSLKESHLELAEKLKVSDRLHILGYRNDVIRIMKSCDIFVFPSLYEGLPFTLIESQVNGLPVIASNNIDKKVKFNENFVFESLDNVDEWLINLNKLIRITNISNDLDKYNIDKVVKKLEEFYKGLK